MRPKDQRTYCLDKRYDFCRQLHLGHRDIAVNLRLNVLQDARPKWHATAPQDRREARAQRGVLLQALRDTEVG